MDPKNLIFLTKGNGDWRVLVLPVSQLIVGMSLNKILVLKIIGLTKEKKSSLIILEKH